MAFYDRPDTLPQWAALTVNDPTSGQPNIATPTSAEKAYGWGFRQYPVRQFFNWLGNLTWLWLRHLDGYSEQFRSSRILQANAIEGLCVQSTSVETIDTYTYGAVSLTQGTAMPNVYEGDYEHPIASINDPASVNYWFKPLTSATRTTGILSAVYFNNSYHHTPGASNPTLSRLINGAVVADGGWAHLFIVRQWTGETTEDVFFFDDNSNGTNLATYATSETGGTLECWRRIASLYWVDSTNGFVPVKQYGDRFIYDDPSNVNLHTEVAGLLTDNDTAWHKAVVKGIPVGITSEVELFMADTQNPPTSQNCTAIMVRSAIASVDGFTARTPSNPSLAYDRGWKIPQSGDYSIMQHSETVLSDVNGKILIAKDSDNDLTPTIELVVRGYTDLRGKDWTTVNPQQIGSSQYWTSESST